MKIAVLKELAAGETRVAATPETVKKFIALGTEFAVEKGAGASASIPDEAYAEAGATIGTAAATVKDADIVLAIQAPESEQPPNPTSSQNLGMRPMMALRFS